MEKLKYYCNKNNIKITNIEYKENINCRIEVTKEEKDMLYPKSDYDKKVVNILKYNIIKEKYIRK